MFQRLSVLVAIITADVSAIQHAKSEDLKKAMKQVFRFMA